jgi:hypothetical protein
MERATKLLKEMVAAAAVAFRFRADLLVGGAGGEKRLADQKS